MSQLTPSERRINAAVDTLAAGHASAQQHLDSLTAWEAACALDRLAWRRAHKRAHIREVPEWLI